MAYYKHDLKNIVANDAILGPQWHPTKNPELNPNVLTTGSGKRAMFLCPFGHEYSAIIRRAGKCPICAGRVVTPENCLAHTHPEILEEWDNKTNGGKTPYNITKNTTTLISLNCPSGHLYQMQVHWWVRGRRCPYCAGKKVATNDSLAVKYPEIAQEWHHEKNGTLTPQAVLPKSHKMVWWLCKYGHAWQARVFSRVGTIKNGKTLHHGTGCPTCAHTTKI